VKPSAASARRTGKPKIDHARAAWDVYYALTDSECEQQPKAESGDCEEQTEGNEFSTHGAPINQIAPIGLIGFRII